MLNKDFILTLIAPLLNCKNEISESEFFELFGNLEPKEQYEVINIMIENNIDYVDEKEEETKELQKLDLFVSTATEYKNIKSLSNELLCHMAQNGDKTAMSAIIENNRRFIYKIALHVNRVFKQNSLSIDDLFQEGCIGALEGVKNFDTTKDIKFVTYSWHWIRQKITRAIIETGYVIRIPVHKFDKMIKVLNCQKQNIDASTAELSCILGDMYEDEVIELLIISENYLNTTSLNSLVGEDQSTELADILPFVPEMTLEDEIMFSSLQTEICKVLHTLTAKEQRILELRFGIEDGRERTLEEVGTIYNVTRERIRQIEAKALRKLRHPTRLKKLKDFLD